MKENYQQEVLSLAEVLLLDSFRKAIERTRGKDKKDHKVYRGVKCQWKKPTQMKNELKNNTEIWEAWVKQTLIFLKNGKNLSHRPTLDRIETEEHGNRHYNLGNIQVLSYADNVRKAKSTKCVVFIFDKDLGVKNKNFNSFKEFGEYFKIPYNTINTLVNSGRIVKLSPDRSLLVQTVGGEMKKNSKPLYEVVINYRSSIVDSRGNEKALENKLYKFKSYGLWVTAS